MRLSNFEETKLNYYNRQLGNSGDREFNYFSLDEAMDLYKSDAQLLSYLPAGDPAEKRFMTSVNLLRHYHELLHKKNRKDDFSMVYRLTSNSHPAWRMSKETFTGFLQAAADLYALKPVFLPGHLKVCHLWPLPAADRNVIDAFFKDEAVSVELVSPAMALVLEQGTTQLGLTT